VQIIKMVTKVNC